MRGSQKKYGKSKKYFLNKLKEKMLKFKMEALNYAFNFKISTTFSSNFWAWNYPPRLLINFSNIEVNS